METLNRIQKELKAPKSQRNTFGNYNYRNAEDILEAVKPLLGKAVLTLTDEIVLIGDRYYVKAQAILTDGADVRIACAYAREALDKKGMDVAQITGAASSYARKYALNGLFCIDDTKDADHGSNTETVAEKAVTAPKPATSAPSLKKMYDDKMAKREPGQDDEGELDPEQPIKTEHLITDKQRKMLYAKWHAKGIADDTVKAYLKEKYGTEHTKELLKDWMDDILAWIAAQ